MCVAQGVSPGREHDLPSCPPVCRLRRRTGGDGARSDMAQPRADALRYTHTAPLGLTCSPDVTCMHTLFNAHS